MNLSALCYGLGYLVGFLTFLWMAHRRGLNTVGVRGVAVAGLLGGLAGANLTDLSKKFDVSKYPSEFSAPMRSGLTCPLRPRACVRSRT